MITKECVGLVKRFEGFSPTVYLCPAAVPTIGYGHVVIPAEMERFKNGITKEDAEKLLMQDLNRFDIGVRARLKGVSLPVYSINALTALAFNIGLFAFQSSTLRRMILRGEILEAADQFLRWVFAGGRRLKGLKLRRQAERRLFLEGIQRSL